MHFKWFLQKLTRPPLRYSYFTVEPKEGSSVPPPSNFALTDDQNTLLTDDEGTTLLGE